MMNSYMLCTFQSGNWVREKEEPWVTPKRWHEHPDRVVYPWVRRATVGQVGGNAKSCSLRLTIKFQILTALLREDDFKNKIWLSLQFKIRVCVRKLKNRMWLMPCQMTCQKKWLQRKENVLRVFGYTNIYRSERWRGTRKMLRRNHSLGCRNKEGWVFTNPHEQLTTEEGPTFYARYFWQAN